MTPPCSLGEWLRSAEARLAAAGIESARLEAQVLAAHILQVDRTWLFAHPEHEFPDLAGEALLQRREAREPLAYLLGTREFYGRTFRVTPAVLIPRQETEILVEAAMNLGPVERLLDVGTGSGAIAVTLKLERPEWEVHAVDLSPAALSVAELNADTLGADVRFAQSDLFAALPNERFGRIVSNPPYIADGHPLMPEVADHEPPLALFGGPDGLAIYRRLAQEAPEYLLPNGELLVEVGFDQADPVLTILQAHGWRDCHAIADLGGVSRVVVALKP